MKTLCYLTYMVEKHDDSLGKFLTTKEVIFMAEFLDMLTISRWLANCKDYILPCLTGALKAKFQVDSDRPRLIRYELIFISG